MILNDEFGRRVFPVAWKRPGRRQKILVALMIGAIIAGCGWLVWATGGIKFVYAHLMYVPIVLAALVFQIPGGVLAALAGGLVLGPYMPVDTMSGEMQAFGNWFFRVMIFTFIGLITGLGSAIYRDKIRNGLRWNARLAKKTKELSHANRQLLQAQNQLARQERLRALGQMASGISHDFNNALTPILGYAELLTARPEIAKDPEKLRASAENILMAGRDAAEIVSRLKSFFREKDECEEFTQVDMAKLVEESILLTRPRWKSEAERRRVSIQLKKDVVSLPGIPVIVSELRQALVNLVFNAVDAMPNGGTITIRCGRGWEPDSEPAITRVAFGDLPSSYACIEIRDSGDGMDATTLQQCVEPFFTTKGDGGTGLGLAMVFGTMRRHDGRIEINSQIGEGTAVRLFLPVDRHGVVGNTGETTSAPSIRKHRRILVVDDDTSVREVLVATLESDGHSVRAAADGRQALAILEEEPADIVITDHGMPELPGPVLARRIRERYRHTRIILCSGNERTLDPGSEITGIDRFLAKPVELNTLRRMLDDFH